MSWQIKNDAVAWYDLPVPHDSSEIKHVNRRKFDVPLGATVPVVSKGKRLPVEIKLDLEFQAWSEHDYIQTMVEAGVVSIKDLRGRVYTVEYDGDWTATPSTTFDDDAIIKVSLNFIEVAA